MSDVLLLIHFVAHLASYFSLLQECRDAAVKN